MMKKTYINPKIHIIKLRIESLMQQTSPPFPESIDIDYTEAVQEEYGIAD